MLKKMVFIFMLSIFGFFFIQQANASSWVKARWSDKILPEYKQSYNGYAAGWSVFAEEYRTHMPVFQLFVRFESLGNIFTFQTNNTEVSFANRPARLRITDVRNAQTDDWDKTFHDGVRQVEISVVGKNSRQREYTLGGYIMFITEVSIPFTIIGNESGRVEMILGENVLSEEVGIMVPEKLLKQTRIFEQKRVENNERDEK